MNSEIRKHEELYLLSKEALTDEIGRNYRLEEKATRIMQAASLVLVLHGFFIRDILGTEFTTASWFSIGLTIWFMVNVGLILWSIFQLIGIYKLARLKKNWITDKEIEYFESNTYVNIIYSLAKQNSTDAAYNRKENNTKAHAITNGYGLLRIGIVSAGLFILVWMLNVFVKLP